MGLTNIETRATPHFLADQLTLSQPGGAHYPHPVLCAPPRFSDLATALLSNVKKRVEDESNFFGLLRIYELYDKISFFDFFLSFTI